MSIRNRASLPWHGVAVGLILGALLPGAPLDGQVRSGPLLIGTGAGYAPFVIELPTGEYEGLSFDMASGDRPTNRTARHPASPTQPRRPLRRAARQRLRDDRLPHEHHAGPCASGSLLGRVHGHRTELSGLPGCGNCATSRIYAARRWPWGPAVVSDTWATLNEAWLGFSVQRYSDTGDALRCRDQPEGLREPV